jgi:hypothetical protein
MNGAFTFDIPNYLSYCIFRRYGHVYMHVVATQMPFYY